ncbi:MAG: glycosyltransferase family 4 protein [Actinomycetota bacterium]|jgi:glycosyltransferase involved in cell wall biosynthesis
MKVSAGPSRRVVILQKFIAQYRVPFFEALRSRLAEADIELIVGYGAAAGAEAMKRDEATLRWGQYLKTRYIKLGRKTLVWQPHRRLIREGDLVVVEQASKLISNYALFWSHARGHIRLALWGHGQNLVSSNPSRIGEALKRWFSTRPAWWFAYTNGSARYVTDLGFPEARVTSVQNAIDTVALRAAKGDVDVEATARLKRQLGITTTNVAIYCGSLYHEKRLDFLLEASKIVRRNVSDFELIVIGAGELSLQLEGHAKRFDWLHIVGPAFDREKAQYFSLAKVMLIPGLVGLAVLDSFVLETPLIAIDGVGHAPEIEYLESGENGLLLPAGATPADYAAAIQELLCNEAARRQLIAGCRRAAAEYTIENMAERFARGIELALHRP